MSETTRNHRNDAGALFAGLFLIGLGSLFLVDRFDIADFGDLISMWWPMIIVLAGVSKLFHRKGVASGVWLIGIGAWLQLVRLHLFHLTFSNSWPLLLIILGGGMTLHAVMDTFKEQRHE